MTTTFYILAGTMVAGAMGLLLILPRLWHRSTRGESTIDWLRLRRIELQQEEDGSELLTDAELRVLDETPLNEVGGGDNNTLAGTGKSRPALLAALAIVALLPFVLYRQLGSIEDVRIADQLRFLESAEPEKLVALLESIEARSQDRPDNADYLSLLGQYYTAGEQHNQALEVYERLLALFPESPEVLARAAQAEYLATSRELTPTARRRAEAALAVDANQRTALGMLGMAAFESAEYAAAINYWERLIRFEAPGSPGFEMMTSVIAEARSRGGIDAPAVAAEGVAVTVSAPVGAEISADATVFILARPANSAQRMPTAVVRRTGADLPVSIRLDDSNAMAGQKISALSEVDIEVQVSPSGQPGRANASWLATASNVVPSTNTKVDLTLRPATP